jgi:hypothetical protein
VSKMINPIPFFGLAATRALDRYQPRTTIYWEPSRRRSREAIKALRTARHHAAALLAEQA